MKMYTKGSRRVCVLSLAFVLSLLMLPSSTALFPLRLEPLMRGVGVRDRSSTSRCRRGASGSSESG
jgi:hypothetical protein